MAAVKIYMSLKDQRRGLAAYKPTLDRLGIELTPFPELADSVLPLYDYSAAKIAGHPRYMPAESLAKLLNRDRLHETGLPTLPTTVIDKPEDAPAGSIVKPRNSITGGFVYQPNLGFPIEDLQTHFTVNASGDIQVVDIQRNKHLAPKKSAEMRTARPDEYVGVEDQITTACKRLGIAGGLHDVQFLFYEGAWCVTDWNPRASEVFTEGITNKYPCLDVAFAHMVGLPPLDVTPAIFINRAYWENPIPLEKRALIEQMGFVPRIDVTREVNGFVRVNGVGTDVAEINAKFDALERML